MINKKQFSLESPIFRLIQISLLISVLSLASAENPSDQYAFYAIYDKVFQKEQVVLNGAALSGDGSKLILSGHDFNAKKPVIFMLNSDGSDLESVRLPEEIKNVEAVTINHDGSRAFFNAEYHLIFKVEGGAATQIMDANKFHLPVAQTVNRIKTTDDGNYVYYCPNPRDGIWRISQNGEEPEQFCDPAKAPLNEYKGQNINSWDISGDGKMAFALYVPSSRSYDLITYDNEKFRQIYKNISGERIGMSGDGNVVVFNSNNLNDMNYYSIGIDGRNFIPCAPRSWMNFAGIDLTYNGSKMFYKDASSEKGRIANTDGTGFLDIFPTAYIIDVGSFQALSISNDGMHISFICEHALYVGHLNDRQAVFNSPVIDSIAFEPRYLPMESSKANITLTAKVSDLRGLSDIAHVACTELIDGKISSFNEIPIYFDDPNDAGNNPDQTAVDGVYSAFGKPGGKIGNIAEMTVRVSAMDQNGTVVLADTILSTSNGISPAPEEALPPLLTPTPEQMAEWVSLYENAPAAAGTLTEEPGQQPQIGASPGDGEDDSFSLLEYLQYNPDERHQGGCGNCWQWAGTAIMEIQLNYRKKIKDRLSIEYINSNIAGSGYSFDGEPCCGDWLDTFTKFYANRKHVVPWKNLNAGWNDGGVRCKTCPNRGESTVPPGSTSTSPAYSITSISTESIPVHGLSATTATNNIKAILHQGKAVWFAYFLPNKDAWSDFKGFWLNQGEDIVYQMDSADGTQFNYSTGEGGGHAVVIVGYDETDPNNRYWIVLNSWGTANGLRSNGIFRIRMDMNYDCRNPGLEMPQNYALYFLTLDVTYSDQSQPPEPQPPQPPEPPINTDPWTDPGVRTLIDEWLQLNDMCLKKDEPEHYIDRWARYCGGHINCELDPDHPAGWDNYHWIWINALGPGHLGITLRDYVERRQKGESYQSFLGICAG
jgi:hypothetical protein